MRPTQILVLEIRLKHLKPNIWRILHIPSNFTLHQLHSAIQVAFAWECRHLYYFQKTEGNDKIHFEIPDSDSPDVLHTIGNDPKAYKLRDIFLFEGDRLTYVYDFGDHWEHVIELRGFIPKNGLTKYPNCPTGAMRGPIEDIGGPPMYQRLVDATINNDRKVLDEFRGVKPHSFKPFDFEPMMDFLFFDWWKRIEKN